MYSYITQIRQNHITHTHSESAGNRSTNCSAAPPFPFFLDQLLTTVGCIHQHIPLQHTVTRYAQVDKHCYIYRRQMIIARCLSLRRNLPVIGIGILLFRGLPENGERDMLTKREVQRCFTRGNAWRYTEYACKCELLSRGTMRAMHSCFVADGN